MENFIFIIIGLFFALIFVISVGLFQTSFLQYAEETKGYIVIIRLLAAFFVYVPVTVFTFLLIAMQIDGVIESVEKLYPIPLEGLSYSFVVLILYAFIGWLCCSLTNGGFIRPSTFYNWKMRKPLSITNSEER